MEEDFLIVRQLLHTLGHVQLDLPQLLIVLLITRLFSRTLSTTPKPCTLNALVTFPTESLSRAFKVQVDSRRQRKVVL